MQARFARFLASLSRLIVNPNLHRTAAAGRTRRPGTAASSSADGVGGASGYIFVVDNGSFEAPSSRSTGAEPERGGTESERGGTCRRGVTLVRIFLMQMLYIVYGLCMVLSICWAFLGWLGTQWCITDRGEHRIILIPSHHTS